MILILKKKIDAQRLMKRFMKMLDIYEDSATLLPVCIILGSKLAEEEKLKRCDIMTAIIASALDTFDDIATTPKNKKNTDEFIRIAKYYNDIDNTQ